MRAACGVLGWEWLSRPDEVAWRDYKQHESQRAGDAIAEDGPGDPQRPGDGVGQGEEADQGGAAEPQVMGASWGERGGWTADLIDWSQGQLG